MITTAELMEKIIERYDPEDYVDVLGIDIETLVHCTRPYLEEFSFRFKDIIEEIEDEDEGGSY